MKELIIRFKEEANKWCAECGFIPALWNIGTEYQYACNPKEKAAWHIIIASLRKNPKYAPYLPKLPEIN